MFRKIALLITPLLLLLAPAGSVAAGISVTLPPLAGLISMLDEQAQVSCLLPAGADPHHFQLTPRKVETVVASDLLIRAPFDDSGWSLPSGHAHVVSLWPHSSHGWLDPAAVRKALPKLAEILQQRYPERADAIAEALPRAIAQSRAIEDAWQKALAPLRQSGVMMQHPSWKALLERMDVPVLAVLESARHGHEHGPHKLEQALATLNTHPGAWLLADHGHSNRALEWLARHSNLPLHSVTLDALGTCGTSWPALMQHNLGLITGAHRP